jgi:hypothetical protein
MHCAAETSHTKSSKMKTQKTSFCQSLSSTCTASLSKRSRPTRLMKRRTRASKFSHILALHNSSSSTCNAAAAAKIIASYKLKTRTLISTIHLKARTVKISRNSSRALQRVCEPHPTHKRASIAATKNTATDVTK